MVIFAERLKLARKEKRLTQRQLASKLGIVHSTIALYETGERKPDLEMLCKIADFFAVSTDWLLGRGAGESGEEGEKHRPLAGNCRHYR